MIPDIVVRLRGDGGTVDIPEIMHEAATEIDRLRGRLAKIAGMPDEDNEWDAVDKYREARAAAST